MKKNLLIVLLFALIAVLASCSKDLKPKDIEPTATEFTSGELAKYIEVDDGHAELSYAETDDAVPAQYIRLKVTLKMKKDGLKDVDPQDINFTKLLAVATINLVDDNGTTVQEISIKSDEMPKLKKLLTGKEGDTEEIVFEGEFHNSDDAPKWFEKTTKFTPYLAEDITTEKMEESDTDVSSGDDLTDDTSSSVDESETSDADVEELLDSYEDFVDEYISYLKKAANGDMTALEQYPDVMQKAKDLDDKLKTKKGSLSSEQLKRYLEITNKMTKAAQEMQ